MSFSYSASVTVARRGQPDAVIDGVIAWPSGNDQYTLWLPSGSDVVVADVLTLADGSVRYVAVEPERFSSPFTQQAGVQIVAPLYPQMLDTCEITHPASTHGDFDSATGTYAAPAATSVYAGPCRVDQPSPADRIVQAGEEPVALYEFVVSLPYEVDSVARNDRLVITASPDPALVDLNLRVHSVDHGSQLTFRRLGCEREDA